ncbi:hypothetical protein LCGC14_1037210 [marine sediment metagenome]|uniref:Uncharacterized protein n=1 Tax=marine sediment metagenome TaxID=412755 RepID=A0A0F9MSV7_9ZZZZ
MTFEQATSSGRDFRHPGMTTTTYYGFDDNEELTFFYKDGQCPPCLPMRAFSRDDWEFVEDEPEIGKGDEVQWSSHDEKIGYPKVIGVHDSGYPDDVPVACLQWPDGSMNIRNICDCTLIHKAPKVHTFEGVKIWKNGIISYPMQDGTDPQSLEHGSLLAPFHQDSTGGYPGKTYTMTLTPEGGSDNGKRVSSSRERTATYDSGGDEAAGKPYPACHERGHEG